MNRIKQQFHEIIRFFSQMVPNIKRHIYIAFFAGLSGIFFNLLSAYMLKGIYSAVTSENSDLLYRYICFFILLLAGVFTYNCIWWSLYGSSSARITGRIRQITLSKLCSLRLTDVRKRHSADMMSIMTNDLDTVQDMYINIRFYITTLVFSIVPSILVFNISGALGLLIVVLGILQLIANILAIKPLERQSLRIRENLLKINGAFSDVLRNNKSIRLYCSEDFYMQVSKDIYDFSVKTHDFIV